MKVILDNAAFDTESQVVFAMIPTYKRIKNLSSEKLVNLPLGYQIQFNLQWLFVLKL